MSGPLGDPGATADRILDAAGRCFATAGVVATTIADVARAAGVSRPTVYRWFADRDALLAAFVQRAALRLGADVARTVRGRRDPDRRLVDAVLAALDGVRADATLAAWFAAEAAGAALGAAASEPVIDALASAFLGDRAGDDDEVRDRARWIVRVTVSLLAMPGRDRSDERALLERFLVPVVAGPPGGPARVGARVGAALFR